jgi:Flp pilus assembly protein CpaB
MEANRQFGKSGSGSKGLNDRKTALLVAGVSAVLAAVLIYLFVTHYNKNNPTPVVVAQDVTVLEAKQQIPANTPETQLVAGGLLKPTHIPQSQVVAGALNNPALVVGESTSVAIPAGQQITAGDFTKTPVNAITPYIKGDQRGVAFTLDAEHGLTSFLQPNSTVDVMAVSGSSTQLLLKNVTVIGNSSGLVILRLTDKQALVVTAATTNHTLWLAMRPTINATNSVQVGTVGSDGSNG